MHIENFWIPGPHSPEISEQALRTAVLRVNQPMGVIRMEEGQQAVVHGGTYILGKKEFSGKTGFPLKAFVPELHPKQLGDTEFKSAFNLQYAYIAGEMANGISSVEMVEAMAKAGMIGFFGAAGLTPDQIEKAIVTLQHSARNLPFGFNLIHSPTEPELEASTVRLYLKHGIRCISAAAYMDLTLPVVYYRVKGIHKDPSGRIVCPNQLIAKVSRVEVARKFFSPPPAKLLNQLVEHQLINKEEAALASFVPMADALTAEADSGGHTDNRPAISLLPTMLALRDEIAGAYGYFCPPHVGLGGGISTPESAAAAFSMGAAYILTGSINQACMEAGTSPTVRQMLAEADPADVTMAPAADMFEMGIKVQVLKRGTLFPYRAAKLYDLYCSYNNLDDLPENQRHTLERDFYRCSLAEEWKRTRDFFSKRDPKQIEKAEKDPKHKMALVFRSYLGRSSAWAITGQPDRKIDYQIWCGPSMGAFNQWVKGSFLEKPENRKTVLVAMNLLLGASVITRANWLRNQGVSMAPSVSRFSPLPLSDIHALLNEV